MDVFHEGEEVEPWLLWMSGRTLILGLLLTDVAVEYARLQNT
jgi:hypothetical protein